MISIAICDDDLNHIISLEQQLNDYFIDHNEEASIKSYKTATGFVEHVLNSQIDIAFIDIILSKDESGVNVGETLRKQLSIYNTIIIYISSCKSYTLELINTNPFAYLVKPIKYEDLKTTLNRALKALSLDNTSISVRSNGEEVKICYYDIIYLESVGRKCKIHTNSGEISVYTKLSVLENRIHSPSFITIHKSFLVNFAHVVTYRSDCVILDNGVKLSISKSHRKYVKEKYMRYFI